MNKEEGIRYYKMAADRGNAVAANNLASILLSENGSMVNENIIKYYKIAADNGCVEAMGTYATLLYIGNSVATSLIEGKNNFPMNKTIGKEYLERSIKNKNVESIKYYSKNFDETKLHFILNEISSVYESSKIKVYLLKNILSNETFDIETSTKDKNINYELAKELSKESSDMGNLRGMLIYG